MYVSSGQHYNNNIAHIHTKKSLPQQQPAIA